MKKILIVVDYQRDFVDGSLGFPGAVRLEDHIVDKIGQYRRDGGEVAFTFDTHEDNYLATQEGRNLPVPHCLRGTPGWDLYGKVALSCAASDRQFEKNTFGSLRLAEYLRDGRYDSVELCGLVSNICVVSNAILAKAALPEAEILVDAACTDSYDPAMHQKTLDILQGVQVRVI